MHDYLIIYYNEEKQRTVGLTLDGTYQVLQGKPVEVFENWCNGAGTSLQGRVDCFKKKTGIVQKAPIYVGGVPPVIFIPTTSMKKMDCIYLRADQIHKIRSDGIMSWVTFKQNITYPVPACSRSLKKRTRLCLDYIHSLKYPG